MDWMEAIYARHSVRSYLDKAIEAEKLDALRTLAEECNREYDLNIQLVTNEPRAFSGFLTHYGLFDNITNYIALAGRKRDGLDEACGYCGEKLVPAVPKESVSASNSGLPAIRSRRISATVIAR